MKFFKIVCVMICVLTMTLAGNGVFAADLIGKKVVVVASVHESKAAETGYLLVMEGINEAFKTSGITPIYQWAEMTYLPTDEEKAKAGDAALAKARAEKPDLIIMLGDDALKFVGARIDDIPIVFAYIWGAPNALGMPKDNVTGIIRTSYAADIWRMTNKLFGAKTVGMISKGSTSMEGIKKILEGRAPFLEKESGVLFKDMILCETFEEWEKAVTAFPYDFLYMADTSRIVKDGKELPRQELVRWTVENAKVPVIAAADSDVEAGGLLSIVTSEKAMGALTAETSLEILNGVTPSQVYKQSKKGKLLINAKTAQKYKVNIPYDILSTAEKIYE
jgi:ABC-type uncharacterized transport system substrate-binding protein